MYPAFSWIPGSKEIVVWAKGKIWRVDPFAQTAREIAFHVKDTREVREAVRFAHAVAPESFDVRQLRWVNVAPQGNKVVYSALGHLYVRDLPNGTPVRLTRQDDHFEYFPAFSRDGQRIVFSTWNDEKLGSVRTIDLRSGKETVLTSAPGKYLELLLLAGRQGSRLRQEPGPLPDQPVVWTRSGRVPGRRRWQG
ncbi:hypothetical protein LP419_35655 [Massilia sp. H-1]|nr:hypothetical protein LP419_35655 [Massilia sp. H-1]